MTDSIENHKGQECIYVDGKLCQEGYCSECWIYTYWQTVDGEDISELFDSKSEVRKHGNYNN